MDDESLGKRFEMIYFQQNTCVPRTHCSSGSSAVQLILHNAYFESDDERKISVKTPGSLLIDQDVYKNKLETVVELGSMSSLNDISKTMLFRSEATKRPSSDLRLANPRYGLVL